MKKLIALVLTSVLALSMVGCKINGDADIIPMVMVDRTIHG